jgi:hypothetical protein
MADRETRARAGLDGVILPREDGSPSVSNLDATGAGWPKDVGVSTKGPAEFADAALGGDEDPLDNPGLTSDIDVFAERARLLDIGMG